MVVDRRARLKKDIIQACQCLRSWDVHQFITIGLRTSRSDDEEDDDGNVEGAEPGNSDGAEDKEDGGVFVKYDAEA